MKSSNSLYDVVQIILFSTAIACMVIAAVISLFGNDIIFVDSWFPTLAIIILLSVWLLRMPKNQNLENE